jgi:AraC-like DNA-binding protein
MPGSYLGYIRYGAAATIHVPDVRVRDDYWMHVSVRGGCEIVNGAGCAICLPNQAVFSSPRGHRTRSEAGSSRFTLSVSRATMLGRLTALLGDAPSGTLDFALVMDLTSRPGRRLIRHVQVALEDLDESDEAIRDPTLLGMYEELIVTAMLLSQPHSFTDRLQRLERPILPRDVRRALEYIDAHLDAPITLAGLAAVTGVPGRTLVKHFKDHHGVSPMRYWRNQRFARVRQRLLQARDGETVTDIATAWGFYHLGRFALEYSQRFGESPSQTRRRGT